MSYHHHENPRRRVWRFGLLLILTLILVVMIRAWYQDWQTPQEAMADIFQQTVPYIPSVVTQVVPLPVPPTPPMSDRVALVSTEFIPNPQSEAFIADLYVETSLNETVPWPNAGGRTETYTYTVESGDNLYGIAGVNDLDLDTLLWANPAIDPDNPIIGIGQALLILPVQGVYHRVTGEETVAEIAARYGVPVTHITNYPPNNLTRPFIITAGQGLIVPYGRQPQLDGTLPPLEVETPLAWPLIGLISKGFHEETHPGIRINSPEGATVQAAANGKVKLVSENQGGFIVVLAHEDGLESWYGHLQETPLQLDDDLRLGDFVGQVGGSDSQGEASYLYFAVYQEGEPRDPLASLPGSRGE